MTSLQSFGFKSLISNPRPKVFWKISGMQNIQENHSPTCHWIDAILPLKASGKSESSAGPAEEQQD